MEALLVHEWGLLTVPFPWLLTRQGPSSMSRPVIELHPGPPLSHMMTSSLTGSFRASNHQKKRCLSSSTLNIENGRWTNVKVSAVSRGDHFILTESVALHSDLVRRELRMWQDSQWLWGNVRLGRCNERILLSRDETYQAYNQQSNKRLHVEWFPMLISGVMDSGPEIREITYTLLVQYIITFSHYLSVQSSLHCHPRSLIFPEHSPMVI